MIVQPDFLEHWKTRQLVELTDDEAAPLAVIRLWAHCQNSKRGCFPDMTPKQLASICRWGDRKPACHIALVNSGFVEKLSPRGYTAHEWSEHNRQLIQKWEAGKNGGRPQRSENPNELPPDGKPTDNRPIIDRELDRTDRIELTAKNRTEQINAPMKDNSGSSSGSLVSNGVGSGSGLVEGLAESIARSKTAGSYPEGGEPSLEEVRKFMGSLFLGAGDYAHDWLKRMKAQGWKDHKGQPVKDWKKLAGSWASSCEKRKRGVTK